MRVLGSRAQKLVSDQLGRDGKVHALLSWLLPDAKSQRRAA